MLRHAWWLGIAVLYSALPPLAQEQHVLVRRGQQLVVDHGCYGCYSVGKMGTPMGPDLSNMGAKYSSSYLIGWVRDPSTQKPMAYMPKIELTDDDIQALAAYLSSLR